MTEILYRWLDEELRIPVSRNADDFLKEFSNGQMLGKILNVEGVLPDKKFDQLRSNDLYEDRLHNFLVIGPYMKMLGVNLSVRQARDILSDKPGSLTYLIYQVYLAMHRPREHLRLRSPEPLPDAYKERLQLSARPDLRDSGVTGLALNCQCYGQQVAKTRLAEAHYVKECQQRITREAEDKKDLAQDIKQQMTEEYMKGDSAKLWGRAFRMSVKSPSQREKERRQAEAAAVQQQMQQFDASSEQRRIKYEDVRNAEFLQTTVTPDMIPDDLVNSEANQQFVHKLRYQLDRDTKARFDREKRRKQMYLALRDEQRRLEEERREMDLVRRLLRQGDYELRLAAHLTDIKRQKQIIVRNRLEKDQQLQERRQDEYERSIQQQMDLLGQKRIEHQDELQKEAQLHRRLLEERRAAKQERRRRMAEEVVEFCMDIAVLTIDYKNKSGDSEVPVAMWNDWRQLFIRGENICSDTEPEELSATSAPTLSQQQLLQEQDLDDYMNVVGEWDIQEQDSARSRKSAQGKDSMALRMESSIVTGFVVHRILRMVYPPKQPVHAPTRPNFTLMAIAIGKSYAGKTQCLKSLENGLGIYHIEIRELVRRSLSALEEETRLDLEAAGSSIMETLKITDILPDLSAEKVPDDRSKENMKKDSSASAVTAIPGEKSVNESAQQEVEATADRPSSSAAVLASSVSLQKSSSHAAKSATKQGGTDESEITNATAKNASKIDTEDISSGSSSSSERPEKRNESVSAAPGRSKSKSKTQSASVEPAPDPDKPEDKRQLSGTINKSTSRPDSEQPIMDSKKASNVVTDSEDSAFTVEGETSEEATESASEEVTSFQFSRFAQLGCEVKSTLESGQRVSDTTLAALVLEAWRELPEESGWILEGYPNTIQQAQLLEEQLVGKTYDSDEEMDEIEIEVRPLPKPAPPVEEHKGKGKKKGKDKKDKKNKKGKEKEAALTPEVTPTPPAPPLEPVFTRVKPFRRSRLVPDRNRQAKSQPTSGLDLAIVLTVSDEVAQQRRCLLQDDVDGQPDSGTFPEAGDEHVMLAGKLFSYSELLQPLQHFYEERGVFREVDASVPLEQVDEQVVELIQVNQEQKEAGRLVEEQRRALLEAAENIPDSEPEEEPEPEPPEKGRKGKPGKNAAKEKKEKSASGKKTSGDGKKGKGGKKGKEAEQADAEAESGPVIPTPPPMPMPGELGYYFVDAPIPSEVASYLALTWQQMEHSYIDNLKQWLGRIRVERAAVIQHLSAIQVSFDSFLLRPDHKQQFLDRDEPWQQLCGFHPGLCVSAFMTRARCQMSSAQLMKLGAHPPQYVSDYNAMSGPLLRDQEVKCEWHMRIQELESTIWNITDTRRCEAEQERYNVMTSGWIEDRLALSANNWLMVMQAEMDRFQDTSLLLEDYFIAISDSQLPDNEGRPRGFKQGMIEIPSREPADCSGASSAGSEGRRSGSRSSSSAKPLRRSPPPRAAAGCASGVLSVITVPQLRPRLQFVRGKNQSEEVTTAVEGVLDGACKAMLTYVRDCKERGDGRVRAAFQTTDDSKGGRGGKKGGATPKPKPRGKAKSVSAEEEAETAAIAAKVERAERAMAEYQASAREETARVSSRLALVRSRAIDQLQAMRQRAVATFQLMWTVIGERYTREVTAAAQMADYLRSAVERQEKLFYELLLDQDRFLVRIDVLTHLPCLPASPPPAAEALQRDCFSLDQIAFLWRQLHRAAPTGIVTTKAFSFMLQDMVVCGVGTQELPELWMLLTQSEIESLSARLAFGSEVMSWRGMLYDLLEPWSRPDQYELHEAVLLAHVFDREQTGLISQEQALQVVHWIKTRLDETEDSFNRDYHAKRLLVSISSAPGNSMVDYHSLLTWLSRSDDVLQSFLCALTVLEEIPVFISNPEDDEQYFRRSQVDLSRIQSLPEQQPTSPPPLDDRPKKLKGTKSGPVLLSKIEDNRHEEVVLKATRSDIYQHESDARLHRQDSVAPEGGGLRLPPSSVPLSSESVVDSQHTSSSTANLSTQGETTEGVAEGVQMTHPLAEDITADARVLAEISIPAPTSHTVDSWTELGPSCCTHPAEAPSTAPSVASCVGPRDTGNKTTLNSVRTVLANTMVLPAELMPPALERLDLDLSLVYRDLYGGSCCTAVEALRGGEPLSVPILDVFYHSVTQRYLSGQCTLLAGRPWQIIKDLRSAPTPPLTSPSKTAAEATSGGPSPDTATPANS